MSDVKTRIDKAKRKTRKRLENVGYKTNLISDATFHVQARRYLEIRVIRICLDEITAADKRLVLYSVWPGQCTKEIWCYKPNRETPQIAVIKNP